MPGFVDGNGFVVTLDIALEAFAAGWSLTIALRFIVTGKFIGWSGVAEEATHALLTLAAVTARSSDSGPRALLASLLGVSGTSATISHTTLLFRHIR